jgi:uncharacterized protein YjbJ (UPF0337 family)
LFQERSIATDRKWRNGNVGTRSDLIGIIRTIQAFSAISITLAQHLPFISVAADDIGANKETTMNWDQVEGKWKQVKGSVKKQWGDLTDDDLAKINGSRDKFVGILQERYGIAKEEAQKRADEWAKTAREEDLTQAGRP